MFVQLLKDFVGRKAGERIDVAEADAKALIASGTAQAVSDDLITPAVQKAMEQAFAGFQKGLDAVINAALKQFQDAQSQARKHAGPALFGPGGDATAEGLASLSGAGPDSFRVCLLPRRWRGVGGENRRRLSMFEFHAGFVHCDDLVRRLSFADQNDQAGMHYFIMGRLEESSEEEESSEQVVPDLANVYIERDDQCWGGYGGIERVTLDRDCLTLKLTPRMAIRMGGHETIRVTFRLKDPEFRELRQLLGFIMYGYEAQIEVRPERLGSCRSDEFSVFQTPSAEDDS